MNLWSSEAPRLWIWRSALSLGAPLIYVSDPIYLSLPRTWTPESCPDISAGTTAAGESLRHLWEGSVEFLGRVSGESPRLTRNLCGVSAASLRSPCLRAPEGLQHTFRHILSDTFSGTLAIPYDIVYIFYILQCLWRYLERYR